MYPKEEIVWARAQLRKHSKITSTLLPQLADDYKQQFKKSIKTDTLKAWLYYYSTHTDTRNPKEVSKPLFRHSEDEVQWARGAISRVKASEHKLGRISIQEMGLAEEFKNQFGRSISTSALYAWLRTISGERMKRQKKDLPSQLLDKRTVFLLVANGVPMTFDSEDNLRRALEDPSVGHMVNEVRLFRAVPINIDRKVTVSIGTE